jgi:hypothetical protein
VLVEIDGVRCLMDPVLEDPFEEGTGDEVKVEPKQLDDLLGYYLQWRPKASTWRSSSGSISASAVRRSAALIGRGSSPETKPRDRRAASEGSRSWSAIARSRRRTAKRGGLEWMEEHPR